MPLQPNGPGPYAPPSTIIEVIEVFRERGLRTPFTLEVLTRAGIPESLAPRTLQALKLLDLIDAEGNPLEAFHAAVRAPEDQFKEAIQDLIVGAYRDVFSFADPGEQNLDRVRDAFRTYTPIGQQDRMVTLFLGLLEWLGLDVGAAKGGPKEGRVARTPKSKRATPRRRDSDGQKPRTPALDLPAPILSLLTDALPGDGQPWTEPMRKGFMATFGALLDFYYPVTTETKPEESDDLRVTEPGT
jgi:hypothetical protein